MGSEGGIGGGRGGLGHALHPPPHPSREGGVAVAAAGAVAGKGLEKLGEEIH